jgi:sugar phosphate isomerase/epimerase
MKKLERRKFLQSSALIATSMVLPVLSSFKKYDPLLSFSTLGCPDWNFDQVLQFASSQGYKGIELRGIRRELNLPACPAFNSPEHISESLKKMQDQNLRFVDLGSSAALHFREGEERRKNLNEGRSFIELAAKLNCPYIRVFPNNLLKEQQKQETIDLMASGLHELGEFAKGSGVKVLMETHGELIHSEDIEEVMNRADHPSTGLVWDVVNMWSVTKEPVASVFNRLSKYIFHTHIKDAIVNGSQINYTFLGQGNTPIFEAIDLLVKKEYSGFFSFEWEKLWHPELAAPELAFADYVKAMKKHFK